MVYLDNLSNSDLLHSHFFKQTKINAQKISVELDDQSLTYAEMGYHVQKIALAILESRDDSSINNEIIYQLVERSIEVPLVMFAVFTIGGIYLALSPDDPDDRLSALIDGTATQSPVQAHPSVVIMVHDATCERIRRLSATTNSLIPINITTVIANTNQEYKRSITDEDFLHLSIINITRETSAFVVCTSGSTGKFKTVEHTHGSEMHHVRALSEGGLFISSDNILQLASFQWTLHNFEIINTLTTGASLVLIRSGGQLDISYLTRIMAEKQVTALIVSATTRRLLTDYVTINEEKGACFRYLRAFVMGGALLIRRQLTTLALLMEKNFSKARIINHYGSAEWCGLTAYTVSPDMLLLDDETLLDESIPIGRLLPGRRCFLIDSNNQLITNDNNIGVIYVSDPAVFKGYRGQDDLTAKVKVPLPSVGPGLFMRTGDLARYNSAGEIILLGREDFRVKIFGQLVAPEEVERTVIRATDQVAACVVRKEGGVALGSSGSDEYLSCHILAPTVSSAKHIEFIRQLETFCRKNLPPFMVPAAWKVYNAFPHLSVGKIDRKNFSPLPRTGTSTMSAEKSIGFG
ncbi:hypothetical protein I4U23_000033 [Adineta vaga]|nr:hypothetical protein I4U23_000033 [Adineta vaga]